jgi:hypothetical protein
MRAGRCWSAFVVLRRRVRLLLLAAAPLFLEDRAMRQINAAGLVWDVEASAAVLGRIRQRLKIDLSGGTGEALVRLIRTVKRSRSDRLALVECALGRQAEAKGVKVADLVGQLDRDGLLAEAVRAVVTECVLASPRATQDAWEETLRRAKLLSKRKGTQDDP